MVRGRTEDEALLDTYHKYIGSVHDRIARGEPEPKLKEAQKREYDEAKTKAVNEARLISIRGFNDLFEAVGIRSSLQKGLDGHSSQIEAIEKENVRQNEVDASLQKQIKDAEMAAALNAEAIVNDQQAVNEEVDQRI